MESLVLHLYYQQKVEYLYLDHSSKEKLTIGQSSACDVVLSSFGFRDQELTLELENQVWHLKTVTNEAHLYVGEEQNNKLSLQLDQNVTFVNVHQEELVIIVRDGKKYNKSFRRFDLPVDETIEIGNGSDCHINILNKHVSKRHAAIYFDKELNEFVLEDLESQNGTYVNRKLIAKHELKDGDEIFIAGYFMMFVRGKLHVSNVENGITIQGLEIVSSSYFEKKPRLNEPIPSKEIKVDEPPKLGERPELNKLTVFLPPLAIIIVMTLASVVRGNYMMLMYSVPMSLISMIVTILNHKNNCHKYDEKVEILQYKYSEYLKSIRNEIAHAQSIHRVRMEYDYPNLDETIMLSKLKDKRLWNRIKGDDDFKQVRIGRGAIKTKLELKVPEKKFELDDDEHKQRAISIGSEFEVLEDMPHVIDLKSCGRIGIVGEPVSVKNHLRSIIANLVTTHDYHMVKLMFFVSESDFVEWRKVRWLPHIFSADRSSRYLATSPQEAEHLSGTINSILQERIEKVSQGSNKVEFKEHYFIIIDDKSLVRTEFYGDKEEFYDKCSVTFIYTGQGIEELPSECREVLMLDTRSSAVYYSQNKESVKYVPDSCSKKNFDEIVDNLAPVKIKGGSIEAEIPGNVPFLDVFETNSINQLNIEQRWKDSQGIDSLRTPIGLVSGGRKLELDIHEKGHGPHGLLAGTSGSGKSELLQSLILSLGINYSADSVAFLIIDYKGGSTAKMFEGIPHLAGVITNLDGQKTQRALLSIKAEVKRRLTEFDNAGVNNVYDYEKLFKAGKVNEAIPHLMLIVDEFAELKMEKPDFMKELVSVARVGRSLGIHLLLATQKPSGVVDEQIWSNSRFKICLKVLNAQDSTDILKRPDASKLVRPGRGYLQVGNNEIYELFQSGYTGATYYEGVKEEEPIYKVHTDGKQEKLETPTPDRTQNEVNQLDAVINCLRQLGERYKPKKLWLPDLSDVEFLDTQISTSDESEISLPLCKVDDPENMDQFIYTYVPEKMGHLALYGQRSTGKSHVIQNLILSMASKYKPDEATAYIVDFAGKSLNMFGALPHVGGVMSDDEEILDKFIKFISKEMRRRKDLYASTNASSLSMFNSISQDKLPALFIFIDNAAGMSELKVPFAPFIEALSREGAAYGVFLVLTSGGSNGIRYKLANNISVKIAMSLVDKSEYSMTVGRSTLEPENIPGRCLINNGRVLRAQMFTQITGDTESEKLVYVKSRIRDLSIGVEGSAKPVPVMPSRFNLSDLLHRVGKLRDYEVVIGLDNEEVEKVSVHFDQIDHFVVSGAPESGKSNMFSVLLEQIKSFESKCYVHSAMLSSINDSGKHTEALNKDNISSVFDSLEKICENNMLKKSKGSPIEHVFIFIEDIVYFNNILTADYNVQLDKILKNSKGLGVHFIASGELNGFKGIYEGLVPVLKDAKTGILLGDVSGQQLFMVTGMPYNLSDIKVGEGFYVQRGKLKRYQSPIFNSLNQEEEDLICSLKSS